MSNPTCEGTIAKMRRTCTMYLPASDHLILSGLGSDDLLPPEFAALLQLEVLEEVGAVVAWREHQSVVPILVDSNHSFQPSFCSKASRFPRFLMVS